MFNVNVARHRILRHTPLICCGEGLKSGFGTHRVILFLCSAENTRAFCLSGASPRGLAYGGCGREFVGAAGCCVGVGLSETSASPLPSHTTHPPSPVLAVLLCICHSATCQLLSRALALAR